MKKRVLIVGSTGFIGPALVEEFVRAGYRVVCGVRNLKKAAGQLSFDEVELMRVDLNNDLDPDIWYKRLKNAKIDGVVNNAGVANGFGRQSIENINFKAPMALFDAVRRLNGEDTKLGFGPRGIRIIQISTTGVNWPDCGQYAYPATKKKTDEALLAMDDLDRVIIRPNVVYEPERGHLLLEKISKIPVIFYIYGGFIQPIFCRELAIGAVRIMNRDTLDCPQILHACGPEQLTWEMIFYYSRRALGGKHAVFVPVPLKFAQWFTMLVQMLPDKLLNRMGILSKMDPETILMMTRGSVCRQQTWSRHISLRSTKLYNVYKAYKKGPEHYQIYLDRLRNEFISEPEDIIEVADSFYGEKSCHCLGTHDISDDTGDLDTKISPWSQKIA